MVRLMHSMVRVNVLSRPGMWDADTYGMPIPQLDQMPAGLIPVYFLSQEVLAKGRTRFTRLERGRVELARYRCYLLGLPEDLLADTIGRPSCRERVCHDVYRLVVAVLFKKK